MKFRCLFGPHDWEQIPGHNKPHNSPGKICLDCGKTNMITVAQEESRPKRAKNKYVERLKFENSERRIQGYSPVYNPYLPRPVKPPPPPGPPKKHK